MIRKGIRFQRTSRVVLLSEEVGRLLYGKDKQCYIALGQVVSYKQWQPGMVVPCGAFRMKLAIPGYWVDKPYEPRITMLWPVRIIPCMGHSRTNMMYGIDRIFWVEDAQCYSTSRKPYVKEKEQRKEARRNARGVAMVMEARNRE
jgi:hypothetical protein